MCDGDETDDGARGVAVRGRTRRNPVVVNWDDLKG